MPPRYAYWTIIFGNQPTSFRTATQEELLPTFKQIQAKHPDAVMMWFAQGRLWKSPEEAQAARDARRYDRRPRRDDRPGGEHRGPRPEWKDRPPAARDQRPPRPEWKDR